MKLSISKRVSEKKSDAKQLRREAQVPGVLYGLSGDNQNISFPLDQLQAILRQIRPGLLSTTIFELTDGENNTHKALIKEIQYHPATYAVLHADFLSISDKKPVTVTVPIQIVGLADCAGIKLGGFMRQVIRTIKVSCPHNQIPQEFTLDIRGLNISESKTLADLAIPAGVKPLAKMNEVAVVIAKKA
jgi:large subunit ribosomal protein L25